jgi:hypothetical protein
MDRYLFRISTKKSNVWSNKVPKPVYYVAETEELAMKWANENLQSGLSVALISKLAVQIGGVVFSGDIK